MSAKMLEINQLRFTYNPQKSYLLNIPSFVVNQGERVFLYGPSGTGKSTLLNLIAGVLQPSDGQILFNQQDFSSLSPSRRDRIRGEKMGYIFQSFNLIPYLSALENILLPTKLYAKGISASVYQSEAKLLLEKLNLSSVKDQRASSLSIGQQQRVAQARALLTSPMLLIADEPTSSLDSDNTNEFMNVLCETAERKKMTLLFVSHDKRLESYFDRSVDLKSLNQAAQL